MNDVRSRARALRHRSLSATDTTPHSLAEAASPLLRAIAPLAVVIHPRRGQKLSVPSGDNDTLYLLTAGLAIVKAALPLRDAIALRLLTPGEMLVVRGLPDLKSLTLTTLSMSNEVWRLRWPALADLMHHETAIRDEIRLVLDRQAAKAALHAVTIGQLSGVERVATLFTELALATGTPAGSGIMFEMPLSRGDMAEYLALNADTISRIVSRMRADRLIVKGTRGRLVVPSYEALARSSPLATTLEAMYGSTVGAGARTVLTDTA